MVGYMGLRVGLKAQAVAWDGKETLFRRTPAQCLYSIVLI